MDIIHYNTDNIVCPHCGYYYTNCDDFEEEQGIETCVNCGEQFTYLKQVFIVWSTDVNT